MVSSTPMRLNKAQLIEGLVKIDNKEGQIVPFKFNKAQRYFNAHKSHRNIIIKARQLGISSSILADMYTDCITLPMMSCAVVSHETRATQRLLDRVQFYYDSMDDPKPVLGASSRSEKTFPDLHSSIYIGTAGGRAFGRGDTIRKAHASELAWWEDGERVLVGMEDAVPITGELTIETTPNGEDNIAYERWAKAREGKSPYKAFFFPWWWEDGYRISKGSELALLEDKGDLVYLGEEIELIERHHLEEDQIRWRRWKIAEKGGLFWQEFPEDEVSCLRGDTLIGTARGIIPVKDIQEGDVLSTGTVIAKKFMGIKSTIILRTELGFELICTSDHRIMLPDGSFVEAKESLGKEIKLSPPKFADQNYTLSWRSFGNVQSSLEIDESWAEFLGIFMGDGSTTGTHLDICFDAKDEDFIQRTFQLVSNLFALPHIRDKRTNKDIRIDRTEFKDLFRRLGLVNEYTVPSRKEWLCFSRKVCVPECIWKSPKSVISRFLAGAFEADGYVTENGNTVKFFTKYKKFAQDIQLLLLGFGVHARMSSMKKLAYGSEYIGYELVVNASQVAQFQKEIGFLSERKKERLSKQTLVRRGGRPPKLYNLTDIIKSIEIGEEEEVYDIQMSDEPVFDANGILVHNCFITIGDPVFDHMILNSLAQGCYEGQRHKSGAIYWIPPDPKGKYVIGADSSAGAPGGSYSAAVVLDEHWRVCATFQARLEPHLFASILKDLGVWYNYAELVIERNFTGYAVLGHLQEYPNIYHQRDFTTGKITSNKGFWTNEMTRQYAFTASKDHLPQIQLWDVNLVRQLRGYRYIKYKATAQTFDDLAMAFILAVTARKVAGVARGYQGVVPGWGW